MEDLSAVSNPPILKVILLDVDDTLQLRTDLDYHFNSELILALPKEENRNYVLFTSRHPREMKGPISRFIGEAIKIGQGKNEGEKFNAAAAKIFFLEHIKIVFLPEIKKAIERMLEKKVTVACSCNIADNPNQTMQALFEQYGEFEEQFLKQATKLINEAESEENFRKVQVNLCRFVDGYNCKEDPDYKKTLFKKVLQDVKDESSNSFPHFTLVDDSLKNLRSLNQLRNQEQNKEEPEFKLKLILAHAAKSKAEYAAQFDSEIEVDFEIEKIFFDWYDVLEKRLNLPEVNLPSKLVVLSDLLQLRQDFYQSLLRGEKIAADYLDSLMKYFFIVINSFNEEDDKVRFRTRLRLYREECFFFNDGNKEALKEKLTPPVAEKFIDIIDATLDLAIELDEGRYRVFEEQIKLIWQKLLQATAENMSGVVEQSLQLAGMLVGNISTLSEEQKVKAASIVAQLLQVEAIQKVITKEDTVVEQSLQLVGMLVDNISTLSKEQKVKTASVIAQLLQIKVIRDVATVNLGNRCLPLLDQLDIERQQARTKDKGIREVEKIGNVISHLRQAPVVEAAVEERRDQAYFADTVGKLDNALNQRNKSRFASQTEKKEIVNLQQKIVAIKTIQGITSSQKMAKLYTTLVTVDRSYKNLSQFTNRCAFQVSKQSPTPTVNAAVRVNAFREIKKSLGNDLVNISNGFFTSARRRQSALDLVKSINNVLEPTLVPLLEVYSPETIDNKIVQLANTLYKVQKQLDFEDQQLNQQGFFAKICFWKRSTIGMGLTLREIVTAGINDINSYAEQSKTLKEGLVVAEKAIKDVYFSEDSLGKPLLGPSMQQG